MPLPSETPHTVPPHTSTVDPTSLHLGLPGKMLARSTGAQNGASVHEPLLTTTKTARELLDIGNTKFWALVKSGKIQMVEVGGRRMVLYASLKALAQFSAS